MSKRILKNISRASFTTNSYGKTYTTVPKGTIIIDDSQADQIAAELLQRFGFLKDITSASVIHVETKEVPVKNHKGKTIMKKKKVVRQGRGVKK